jgi:two-component system chemotaxis sensor kinase CheA
MSNPQNAFLEEAYELIAELETALLELENSSDDEELIGRVFRAMHTIKGSGAMFGYEDIAGFTHELETVFDRVREGKMPVTGELINLSLAARDQIKRMLDASKDDGAVDETRSEAIIESLKKLAVPSGRMHGACEESGDASEPHRKKPDDNEVPPIEPGGETTYRIRFALGIDLFKNGTNPLLLLRELAGLGQCSVIAQTERIPDLDGLDPEDCHVYWDIILTTRQGINAIRDVFIFVEDASRITIDAIEQPRDNASEIDYKRIGEILIERGDLSESDIAEAVCRQKRIGEILVETKTVEPGMIESALAEQNHISQVRKKRQEDSMASSIRVAAVKLDTLVDLVGELVTVQARLSEKAVREPDADLRNIAETVERLTTELRDNTMSIRMLPIGSTFSKLKRLVRDLSNELGKDVVMATKGAETELDKTVIEQLSDPLVHIIRNSIDHGIEPPERRAAAGKPRQGKVHLCAEHSGGSVLIRIGDDGAGLDIGQIREKAVGKGLIGADAQMSDKEIFSLIFIPGFSTAATVSSVSGRGVGMDVVKRSMEGLRGSVDIESIRGKGTTITLKLPLTLAVIDGLLVEIGKSKYVLPLSTIEQCVELTPQDLARGHGRNVINVQGRIVPYIPLRERFQIPGSPPDIEQVVINEVAGLRIGMVVDRVVGEHQIVIKTMSRLYRNVEEISGATILGDGTVALILDVPRMLEVTKMERSAGAHASA